MSITRKKAEAHLAYLARRRERYETQQSLRDVVLSEQSTDESALASGSGEPYAQLIGSAGVAQRGKPLGERPRRGRAEQLGDGASGSPASRLTDHALCSGVQFENFLARRIDGDDGFIDRLQQQSVTCLGQAQPRVILLQRLLRFDESLLQGGKRPQVAPERDEPTLFPRAAQVVEHGHRSARDVGMIDLSRYGCRGLRFGEQALDFRPTVHGDGVEKRPSDPVLAEGGRQVVGAHGNIAHDAAPIEHEHHVRCSSEERGDRLGIESGQGLPWRLEVFHIRVTVLACRR